MPPLRVSVEFMGPFEFTFGAARTELVLEGPATVGELLRVLGRRFRAARELHDALGDVHSPRRPYYYVSLDYSVLPAEAVLGTPLHDGARVCVGMPMVGG